MIELHTTKADEVYKQLALTGRYFNTGKVLMGVSYVPRPRPMSHDEERIQSALLESALLERRGSRITAGTWRYMEYVAIVVAAVLMANIL
jgi:hypothetical protein